MRKLFQHCGKLATARIGDFNRSLLPFVAHIVRTMARAGSAEITRPQITPAAPPAGMCEAQRIDFKAACDRKITWREYFRRWGHKGLTL